MKTKTCNYQVGLDFQSTCLRFSVNPEAPKLRTKIVGQHILFLFMCRWTCSRCWKAVMKIGRYSEELQKRDVAVVMVGSNEYIQQATYLAAKLKLPVTLFGDDGNALRKIYGQRISDKSCKNPALILLDRNGSVRHCQSDFFHTATPSLVEIISVLDEPPAETVTGTSKLAC